MEQSKIYSSDVYNQANAVTIKASLSICTLALRNGCLCLLVLSKRALATMYRAVLVILVCVVEEIYFWRLFTDWIAP
jgi:hypothetical protein